MKLSKAGEAKERERFEAWASEPIRADKLPLVRHIEDDGYVDHRTYLAWYAWKARAGLGDTSSGETKFKPTGEIQNCGHCPLDDTEWCAWWLMSHDAACPNRGNYEQACNLVKEDAP